MKDKFYLFKVRSHLNATVLLMEAAIQMADDCIENREIDVEKISDSTFEAVLRTTAVELDSISHDELKKAIALDVAKIVMDQHKEMMQVTSALHPAVMKSACAQVLEQCKSKLAAIDKEEYGT